jgi:hypothetical protein
MLFDLTLPCYLTTLSNRKCLSEKVICAFFVPLIEVLLYGNYPTTLGKMVRKRSRLSKFSCMAITLPHWVKW